MFGFSRNSSPSSVTPCHERCQSAKDKDDATVQAVADRVKVLTGQEIKTSGKEPGDDGPQMIPGDISACKAMAYRMGPEIRRFNRYRAALPAARAANNMNELGDGNGDAAAPVSGDCCLARLPLDAASLNKALGLQEGTITDADLRDDTTGFRAAMYRSEPDGKLLLVARDTQKNALVDWKTNIDNGDGKDTAQYQAMRKLATNLVSHDVSFDLAGYSKGGGLAQHAGLISTNSQVYVFNSAGLPDESLTYAGASSFESLASRTTSYSRPGDFLTYMNDTTDPKKQLKNIKYLRDALAGAGGTAAGQIKIKYRSPELKDAKHEYPQSYGAGSTAGKMDRSGYDPTFNDDLKAFISEIDDKIRAKEQSGDTKRIFPPVHAGVSETLPEEMGKISSMLGANKDEPNLGKLNQHLVGPIPGIMESQITAGRNMMGSFLSQCG